MRAAALSDQPYSLECSGRQGLKNSALAVAGVDARVGAIGLCTSDDLFTPILGLRNEIDLRSSMFYDQIDFVDTIDDLLAAFAAAPASPTGGKIVVQP